MIYRPTAHAGCRFLQRSGRLSRPRSCRAPIALLARGTSHWRLRVRVSLPPGHYVIRSVAVDRLPYRSAASIAIRIS